MNIARKGHTATPLADGRILIVGGENSNGQVEESEVYDPATRKFFLSAKLRSPRADHTATSIPGGHILIVGGHNREGSLSSTEIFDPSTNAFSRGPSLKRARSGHTATVLADGRILIAGGESFGTAEIFDAGTMKSTRLDSRMAKPRSSHSAILLRSGKVLIAGGLSADGGQLSSGELFDPESLQFFVVSSSMKAARTRPTLRELPDGKVQVIGGDADQTMEMFNAEGRYFTARARLVPESDSETSIAEVLSAPSRAALIQNQDSLVRRSEVGVPEVQARRSTLLESVAGRSETLTDLLDRSGHTITEIPLTGTALITGGKSSSGMTLMSATSTESSSATVTTDKTDYAPGETVIISGTGWLAGETVELRLHRDEQEPINDTLLSAVADENGEIQNSEYVCQESDLGVTFLLTATGQTSGYVAQTTFTDANNFNITPATQSVQAGSTNTFIWTFEAANSANVATTTFTVPAGWTAPQIGAGPGQVTVTAGTCAATLNSVSGQVITINQAPGGCDNNDTFTLTYSNATAPTPVSPPQTYTFLSQHGNDPTVTVTAPTCSAPSITCPAPVTVQCDSDVPAPATDLASFNAQGGVAAPSSAACGPVTVAFVSDVPSGSCPKSITRTYKATDAFNNTAQCTQIITVDDQTSPTITGFPADASFSCTSQVPAADDSSVTATDNCGGAVSITHDADVITNQTCANRYTISRTYHAIDVCGNVTNQTQTITVDDQTPPVITGFPADASFSCTSLVPAADDSSVTAMDNCGGTVAITHDADVITNQTCANRYIISRTYHAIDVCGNVTNQTQTITVDDQTPPVITGFPADASFSCTSLVPAADDSSVTAMDNCGGTVAITHDADVITNQTCANRYTISRTYHAIDVCGNVTNQTQTITVDDQTPPVITGFAAGASFSCASQVPAADDSSVTATDNCGGAVSITHDADVITNQTCANRYTITRTYHATDVCGNVTNQSQTITVDDQTPPVITGFPTDASFSCASQVPAADDSLVTATDNCGGPVSITHDADVITNQTCANRYTISRTYHATDVCGNVTNQTQTITVDDHTPPVITGFPTDASFSCASQVPAADDSSVTATDNCGGAVVITHDADVITNQTCANRYTITRTYHATDACGNVTNRSQTITVNDTTAPTITCPSNVTSQCSGLGGGVVVYPMPTASDNCGGTPSVVCSPPPGSVFQLGSTNVNCSATDACGNSGSCSFTVTVNFSFVGLFSPYEPPPRTFKAGSSIPLKWQYTCGGSVVNSSAAMPEVQIFPANCDNTTCEGPECDPIVVDAPGNSGYQYESGSNTWHFNWKTPKGSQGCYYIFIKSHQTGQTDGPFFIQLKR